MNIIVYSQFAGGDRYGMVHGTYCLAREWVKTGDQVEIVSASFSHTRHTQPNIGKSLIKKEIYSGITYVWVKTFAHRPNNLLIRLVNIFIYTVLAMFYASFHPKSKKSFVVCSSHHPFAIFPSLISSFRNKSKLVYEIRDLWPLSLLEIAGLSRYNPLYLVMKWCEGFAIERSDIVISVLEDVGEYVMNLGLKTPVVYIPNGSSENHSGDSNFLKCYEQRIQEDRNRGNLIVVYTGSFGYANRLIDIMESVFELRELPISLYLVGSGALNRELTDSISRLGIQDRVHILPETNRAGVKAVLKLADIAYLGYLDLPLYRYGISPTKINDYLSADLLVLFLTSIPIGELNSCASIIQCRSSAELSSNLKHFTDNREDLLEKAKGGKRWVLKYRSYHDLARRFKQSVFCKS